jgi:hypothetical protein
MPPQGARRGLLPTRRLAARPAIAATSRPAHGAGCGFSPARRGASASLRGGSSIQ